jgi:precorrin-8X/cobalt-precorrin-8 methylmutase
MTTIHPIEVESFRILRERIDLSHLSPAERAVTERVIHASADLEYATTIVHSPGAADAGIAALRSGAPVICDVEMVRHGLTGVEATCLLSETGPAEVDDTRTAAAMRLSADRHPDGAIVVVGCAPTALFEVIALAERGILRPALVIGLPVGFVGAAESKAALRASGLPSISNVGEKGGSAVAAAAVNALVRIARSTDA